MSKIYANTTVKIPSSFYNKEGELSIKGKFYQALANKILDKNVGVKFNFNLKYKNDALDYANGSDCKNGQFDKSSNYIKFDDIANFFQLLSSKLTDRYIGIYKDENNLESATIQVFSIKAKPVDLYIRDKDYNTVEVIPIYDPFTNTEMEEKRKIKKGQRKLTTDDTRDFFKEIEKMLSSSWAKELPKNNDKNKKATATA